MSAVDQGVGEGRASILERDTNQDVYESKLVRKGPREDVLEEDID